MNIATYALHALNIRKLVRKGQLMLLIVGALLFSACESIPSVPIPYGPNTEAHFIGDVVVVYTDHKTINEIYKYLGGKINEVWAFRSGSTIYCEKWDFNNCGHEVHHLTDDAWHK